MDKQLRVAVLIDAENISMKYATTILAEASNLGNVIYKRIYGDWTTPQLSSWKQAMLDNAIQPIQQYSNTRGKNASDSALIIDAMDLLYQKHLDAFCIVSSDSDFTRLASRLRESEMLVLGMGEQKTPRAFISACNRFVYLDLLYKANAESTQKKKSHKKKRHEEQLGNKKASGADSQDSPKKADANMDDAAPKKAKKNSAKASEAKEPESAKNSPKHNSAPQTSNKSKEVAKHEITPSENTTTDETAGLDTETQMASGFDIDVVRDTLRSICEDDSDDDGWINAANLAEILARRLTDFDYRNFGYKKFVPFVDSLKMFESRSIKAENAPGRAVYYCLIEDWTS